MMSSDVDTDKEIFELIDVGILIKSELDLNGRRKRWIDQVGIFRKDGKHQIELVVDNGKGKVPLGGIYEKDIAY